MNDKFLVQCATLCARFFFIRATIILFAYSFIKLEMLISKIALINLSYRIRVFIRCKHLTSLFSSEAFQTLNTENKNSKSYLIN